MNEKLLVGGGGRELDKYTHIVSGIIVEADGEWIRATHIVPATIDIDGVKYTIDYINTNYRFGGETSEYYAVTTGNPAPTSQLYLACYDRKKNYGAVRQYYQGTGGDYIAYRWEWKNTPETEPLFNASDVGKEIPIWLSTTPPPLGLRH